MSISVIEDQEEDTVVGALPVEIVHDQVTSQTPLPPCETCGRAPTIVPDFQRGVNHALQRLYIQLRRHVDDGLAREIVFRLQSDDVEL